MPDLGAISEGARGTTAHYELKDLWRKIKGLFPEKQEGEGILEEGPRGALAEKIAGVSRMVQNPESDSTEWDNIFQDWMDTGEGLEEMSDPQLQSIFDELRGYEGESRYQMIEDLTTYRDRMYGR